MGDLDEDKVRKAVSLSVEKYCSVRQDSGEDREHNL